MNEDGKVLSLIGDFKELGDLFLFRLPKNNRDIEVLQAKLFNFRFLLGRAMLASWSQVQNRFDAISFQLLEVFQTRLSARAKVVAETDEVSDWCDLLAAHHQHQ